MIHITFTGRYAGTPYCGSERNETDQYMHMPYNAEFLRKTLANPELCPACKEVYDDAMKPEPHEL